MAEITNRPRPWNGAVANVLFLDLDGVLNSVNWMSNVNPDFWIAEDGDTQLDPEAVMRLERVVRESGAKIVLSSSWRKLYEYKTIESFLRHHGFTGEVIGETPHRVDFAERPAGTYQRGWEIQAWLDEHPEVAHFAILDDDSDMAHLTDHFVHTKHPHGLQDEHIPQILKLLGTTILEGRDEQEAATRADQARGT